MTNELLASSAGIRRKAVGLSGSLIVVVTALVGALLYFGVLGQDSIARRNSEAAVASSLRMLNANVRDHAVDNAWWDATRIRVVGARDYDWADQNIGAWMFETYGINGSFVLGSENEPIYTVLEGERVAYSLDDFDGGIQDLIEQARTVDMDESVAKAGYLIFQGNLVVLAVAAITPEVPTEAELVYRDRPILGMFRFLDQAFLDTLAEDLLIPGGFRLIAPGADAPNGTDARQVITAVNGTPLSQVTWQAATPGTDLLVRAILPAMLSLGVVALIAFTLFRRIVRISTSLEQAVEHLRVAEADAREARMIADSANAAKSRFLSSVSQELRSPLQAMVGFASLIRDGREGSISIAEITDYAASIHEEGMVLSEMIDDLLEFTRLERETHAMDEFAVDLGYILGVVKTSFEKQADMKAIGIMLDIPDRLPKLNGDERGLRSLFRHLIDNAIKFTPHRGTIEVSLQHNEGSDSTPRSLSVSIRDSGQGMDPAFRQRATAAFEKAELGLSRVHGGIGIGLSLVRLISQRHGARLDIESFEGVGTTVTVTFPASRVVTD